MDKIKFRYCQDFEGSVWISPDTFEGDDHTIRQGVVGGALFGSSRWAVYASDNAIICGVGPNGRWFNAAETDAAKARTPK